MRMKAAIMFEQGLRRVLVDIREAAIDDSAVDLLEFNSSHYDVLPRGCRIGVVAHLDATSAPACRFAETVAFNRGIAMRVFTDDEEALAWLTRPSTNG